MDFLFLAICISVTAHLVTATLLSPPSYVFSMTGDICVYESSAPALDEPKLVCLAQYNTHLPLYLDMNLAKNLIYFTHSDDIYQIEYKEGETHTALMYSAGTITDIAFDWLSGNLYFVDQAIGGICVMTTEGGHTACIFKGTSGIRAIAVDPMNRYIFWITRTSTSRYRQIYVLGRSRLNGSERNNQFYTGMRSPTNMVLDHEYKRIYWTDTMHGSIESIDFNGGDHKILFEENSKYPYSLAVDQNYVVWLDNSINFPSVYWTNKTSGIHTQVDTHHKIFTLVDDILVFGEYSQPTAQSNYCSQNNGGCSHICLAVSDNDRECQCSLGFILTDDNTTCKPAPRGNFADNLIVTDAARGGIYFLNTMTQGLSALDIPRQTFIESATVDPVNDYVFWANSKEETIVRARLDGTEMTVIKTFENGHTIIGLAIDYLEELIFYCDVQAGVTTSLSYSGSTETLILPENDTVALVPDIHSKQVYLAVSGRNSRISRISYDGSSESTLIDDVDMPMSLAVDFETCKMYWVHYYNIFEWSDLDGKNRNTGYLQWHSAILSMSILHDFIYIADWGTNENQVLRSDKEDIRRFHAFGTDEFLHVTKISNIVTANTTLGYACSTSTQSTTTTKATTAAIETSSTSSPMSPTSTKEMFTSATRSTFSTLMTPTEENFPPTAKTSTSSTLTTKPTTILTTKPTIPTFTTKPTTSSTLTSKPTSHTLTTNPTTSSTLLATKPTTSSTVKTKHTTASTVTTKVTTSTVTIKHTSPTLLTTKLTSTLLTSKPTLSSQLTSKSTSSAALTNKPTTSSESLRTKPSTLSSTTVPAFHNHKPLSVLLPTIPTHPTERTSVPNSEGVPHPGADKHQKDDKENDNVPLIAGVTVGLLILVTVAISATVCVLRKRRTIPPSDMVIHNMAFENPEYVSSVYPSSPPVLGARRMSLPAKGGKHIPSGMSPFPMSYHDDRPSITGYSRFHGSFRDDSSIVSSVSKGSHGYHGNRQRNRGGSQFSRRSRERTPSFHSATGSIHDNGSVVSGNSTVFSRQGSHIYDSLPSVYT